VAKVKRTFRIIHDDVVAKFAHLPWVYEFLYHYALDEFREQVQPLGRYATRHGTTRKTIAKVLKARLTCDSPTTQRRLTSTLDSIEESATSDSAATQLRLTCDSPYRETETETDTKEKRVPRPRGVKAVIRDEWPSDEERAAIEFWWRCHSADRVGLDLGYAIEGYHLQAQKAGYKYVSHVAGFKTAVRGGWDCIKAPVTGPGGQKLSNAEAKSLRIKETTRRALEKALLPSVPPGPALPEGVSGEIAIMWADNPEEIE
jgi:hypothetical protein